MFAGGIWLLSLTSQPRPALLADRRPFSYPVGGMA